MTVIVPGLSVLHNLVRHESIPKRDPGLPHFPARKLQIIELVSQGKRNRDIAEKLGTTEQVIKNYMRGILDLTGMDSRLQLTLWWLEKKPAYIAAGVIAE